MGRGFVFSLPYQSNLPLVARQGAIIDLLAGKRN
jgi:hypothetical protein